MLKDNKMWLGYHVGDMAFKVPAYYEERATRFWIDETGQKWRSLGNACWYTNLDIPKRHEPLDLRGNYYYGNEDKYPHYDNYDAINVDRVSDIPCDYDGVMGVPITFLGKYCPEQFEIVSFRKGDDGKDLVFTRERERESSTVLSDSCSTALMGLITGAKQTICSDGKSRYARVAIRRRT